jgi:enoyl-CoA hydratase
MGADSETSGAGEPGAGSPGSELVMVTSLEDGITEIRLNRPERLNAMSFELVTALHDALDEVSADATCKVAILTGSGRAFCAGLDLKDWGRPPKPGQHRWMNSSTDAQTFISNLTVHLRDTPQVVIAAVNGPAFGGGLALACAADVRLCSADARFCSAFIRTGLSGTDIGITYLLPRLIGNARAFDLVLTGREVGAEEALAMGLVSAVAEEQGAGVTDLALQRARMMAGYTRSGLLSTKEILWHNASAPSLEAALALEIRNQNLMQHAPDVQAYMAAYRSAITGD